MEITSNGRLLLNMGEMHDAVWMDEGSVIPGTGSIIEERYDDGAMMVDGTAITDVHVTIGVPMDVSRRYGLYEVTIRMTACAGGVDNGYHYEMVKDSAV